MEASTYCVICIALMEIFSLEQFLDMNIKTLFIEYCGIKKVVNSRIKHIAFLIKPLGRISHLL